MARRQGAQGVAFSFNEPSVTPEYVHDVAHLAKKKGLYTVLVTNGYLTHEAVSYLAPVIDAASIGFKPFDRRYYAEMLGASLDLAMEGTRHLYESIPHVEISYMVKEQDGVFGDFLDFMESLGRPIPLQLERFFPSYHSAHERETSKEKLISYYHSARDRGMPYVYISDIHDPQYERTVCPSCGETVIEREGSLIEPSVSCHCALHAYTDCRLGPDGSCPACGARVLISGMPKRQD
jgi:pyruvate formate lyase activating enzyme